MTKKEQRIKLRCEGSPVKWDGTVTESTPDGKQITVQFDGPLGDVKFLSAGGNMLVSDATDAEGKPVEDFRMAVNAKYWHVL